MQGILITGRPGSGKTSVVKAVAKMTETSFLLARKLFLRLVCEGRKHTYRLTDTIYVDFAKLMDERVPRLKAYFKYLYDKAAAHRPSTLVIDNLDKLLCAEVEASLPFSSSFQILAESDLMYL